MNIIIPREFLAYYKVYFKQYSSSGIHKHNFVILVHLNVSLTLG